MLTMDIVPGKSIGAFVLGMPLVNAIAYIQREHKSISRVELKYSETEPLSVDIILDLNEDGIRLRFEPKTQQLRSIEIYDVPKVVLSYNGAVFSALDKPPTLVNIYERFGPTHPGDYDPKTRCYYLHYPGLSFAFPIPPKHEKLYSAGEDIPPMEFPDGMTPVSAKIFLYCGSIHNPELPPSPPSSLYFEEVLVEISKGITFTKRNQTIDFNSTTQDVLCALGEPSGVFFKEEDKMRIHTNSYSGLMCADYFYNYFALGIDILFDIQTHIVKKFILHTNFPSHYQFNQYISVTTYLTTLRYVKCNFRIPIPVPLQPLQNQAPNLKPQESIEEQINLLHLEDEPQELELKAKRKSKKKEKKRKKHKREESDSEENGFVSEKEKRGSNDSQSDAELVPEEKVEPPMPEQPKQAQTYVYITPDTKWSEIQKLLGPPGKPVVHNRGSNTNPFGATLFYGYKGIIFEKKKPKLLHDYLLTKSRNQPANSPPNKAIPGKRPPETLKQTILNARGKLVKLKELPEVHLPLPNLPSYPNFQQSYQRALRVVKGESIRDTTFVDAEYLEAEDEETEFIPEESLLLAEPFDFMRIFPLQDIFDRWEEEDILLIPKYIDSMQQELATTNRSQIPVSFSDQSMSKWDLNRFLQLDEEVLYLINQPMMCN